MNLYRDVNEYKLAKELECERTLSGYSSTDFETWLNNQDKETSTRQSEALLKLSHNLSLFETVEYDFFRPIPMDTGDKLRYILHISPLGSFINRVDASVRLEGNIEDLDSETLELLFNVEILLHIGPLIVCYRSLLTSFLKCILNKHPLKTVDGNIRIPIMEFDSFELNGVRGFPLSYLISANMTVNVVLNKKIAYLFDKFYATYSVVPFPTWSRNKFDSLIVEDEQLLCVNYTGTVNYFPLKYGRSKAVVIYFIPKHDFLYGCDDIEILRAYILKGSVSTEIECITHLKLFGRSLYVLSFSSEFSSLETIKLFFNNIQENITTEFVSGLDKPYPFLVLETSEPLDDYSVSILSINVSKISIFEGRCTMYPS